ncbi:hypothetical protein Taro_000922 [Colocasia esculenta]|uniref:Uncharacterized protein n=1 Tax=Colocasia esculenta TaxID=4460 RepID=A0A843TDE4_COLES|nr:hypothetical protein [Colocasia esculenta]
MLPFASWLAAIDVAVYLQVVRGRLSRFEELCLSVVGLVLVLFIMAPRRRRERRVVVQTSQQEAGDAPPPPLAQPRPQDMHGGVVPPLPPQATQGFDWIPQLVGGSRPEHWQVLWLTGARGKTLVRKAELDRAENSGSGGDSREKAYRGSTRIEVWQDFLHASEVSSQQAVLSLLP